MGKELKKWKRKNNTKNKCDWKHMYSGKYDNITQNEMEKNKDIEEIIDKVLDMEEKQRRSSIY